MRYDGGTLNLQRGISYDLCSVYRHHSGAGGLRPAAEKLDGASSGAGRKYGVPAGLHAVDPRTQLWRGVVQLLRKNRHADRGNGGADDRGGLSADPAHRAPSAGRGGGVGNIIDRIVHGYVVDMFDLLLFDYPVFNLADCFVVVGVILGAVYYLWFYEKYDARKKDDASDADGDK